jgi:DNA-directed RNA polymerase specialized sigma24 family protein
MTPTSYRDLLRLARRYAFSAEAEDIVQDAVLAAVGADLDPADPTALPWLKGTIRRRAAFIARTAARRRRREHSWAWFQPIRAEPDSEVTFPKPLLALPSAQRSVLALALSGHHRGEIAHALGLRDATLRQRIAALRRSLRSLGVDLPNDRSLLAGHLDHGKLRAALLQLIGHRPAGFGSYDPDGHLFLVVGSASQKATPRQP